LDEIQAALLRVQIKIFGSMERGEEKEGQDLCGEVVTFRTDVSLGKDGSSAWSITSYAIKTEKRDFLQAFLKKRGIETTHSLSHPDSFFRRLYQELRYGRMDLPFNKPSGLEKFSPFLFSRR